jgi:hypothetical protein
MTRTAVFFMLAMIANVVHAQEHKKFRVLVGGGYATGSGYASGGIFGTLEPAYRISEKIMAGIRTELAGIARGGVEGWSVDVDISKISSITLNGVYYFDSEFIRPFAGFGGGSYTLSSIEYKLAGGGPEQGTGKDSRFGFYPRVGVDISHFSFTVDYNIVPKTKTPEGAEFRNSYMAIRLAVFFGGGTKRP